MADFTQAWAWPQWTVAIILLLSLAISANEHGKPRGPHSFPLSLIALIINLFLLICGGFFS